jgi:hypothetical protein
VRKIALIAPVAVVIGAVLAGCSSGGSTAAAAPPASRAAAAAKATPAASCKLKTTFDYIVRDDDPGAQVLADEIGNVDFGNCTSSLEDFAATAGQAQGECTTIAKASDNPGYDVNKIPAPPLKDVISESGPGCGS